MKNIPNHSKHVFRKKDSKYCLVIPVINEGKRIIRQIESLKKFSSKVDIIIADGGSSDESLKLNFLIENNIRALLVKNDIGNLSSQLRIAYNYALNEKYKGIITVDGNGKDNMDGILLFMKYLELGYDMIQGSRFIEGGKEINTPIIRSLAIRYIHAPIISLISGFKYTDTTNGFRAYSKKYLEHPEVLPFRQIFKTYELLAYLSVKAPKLGLRTCEIPVTRSYPKGKTPTKISPLSGNFNLILILFNLLIGKYNIK
jgi:dolichol-phosphate mannosyltransferase